jgi:hypothetical protein
MPFRRPHYYKKKRREHGRRRFADGLLIGWLAALLVCSFLFTSDSK